MANRLDDSRAVRLLTVLDGFSRQGLGSRLIFRCPPNAPPAAWTGSSNGATSQALFRLIIALNTAVKS